MDQASLLQRIKAEFPDLAWSTVKDLTVGWDHHVLLLGNEWVFRFPHGEDNQKNFTTEPALLDFLGDRLPAPIPHYKYVAADGSFGGYRVLPGKIYTTGEIRTLPQSEQQRLAHQLGEFLRTLHAIPVADVTSFAERPTDTAEDAASLRKEVEGTVFSRLTVVERAIITDCFNAYEKIIRQPQPTMLIHGDFSANHILLNEGNVTGIIDWSDRSLNDPAWDFDYLYHISPEFAAMCLSAYGPADPTLAHRAEVYALHTLISGLTAEQHGAPLPFERALGELRAYCAHQERST